MFSSCLHIIIQIKLIYWLNPPLWYFIVAVLLTFFGVMIRKFWRFGWERLILWWSSIVSSKRLVSEIAFFLVTLVLMRPVSTGFSIVLGLCYGLVLGKYGSEWRSSCCSNYIIKFNAKVNFEVFWKVFWLVDYNVKF